MLKHLKSVGMLLFLSTISGGAVYASSGERVTGIDAVQQNGTCTGVVKTEQVKPLSVHLW